MLRSRVVPVLWLLLPAIMAADAPPTDTELLVEYRVGLLTTERQMAVSAGRSNAPAAVATMS